MIPYHRDGVQLAAVKLFGEWSAPDFAKCINKEVIGDLISRFDQLEPLVRMRTLLSCMSLPRAQRLELQTELQVRHVGCRAGKHERAKLKGEPSLLMSQRL
jgi:hypothetical protein